MPRLLGGGIKRCFRLTSDVCLSRASGLTREQRPRKTKIGTEVAHVTRDSEHHFQGQKDKGEGHQAALLSTALTRETGAAVAVRMYWAWETTAMLRLLGGARGAGAPTGEERGGGVSCRHAHSLLNAVYTRTFRKSTTLCCKGDAAYL